MAELAIKDHTSDTVGSILFDENPLQLPVRITATGFNLTFPSKIRLRASPEDRPRLMLNNLRIIISLFDHQREEIEVGRLHDDHHYSAFVSYQEQLGSPIDADLTWLTTFQTLIFIEKFRQGRSPKFSFRLYWDLYRIVKCEPWQNNVRKPIEMIPTLSEPHSSYGEVVFSYPTTLWETMVQQVFAFSSRDPFFMMLPLTQFLSGKKEGQETD